MGTPYRGGRDGGKAVVIGIPLFLALLILGLWFGRGFLSPFRW